MTDYPSSDKTRRLGRGLGALISSEGTASTPPSSTAGPDRLRDIPLDLISANPLQPRREFGAEELRELEESLKATGLLQPVTVRPKRTGGAAGMGTGAEAGFELIAGERRVRAARRLGWSTIPAIVRDINDNQLLTLALVENLQREDLNAIEEAEGFQRLTDEFGFTQSRVADAVGKERSTVANVLRLLNLPVEVQELVRRGQLSEGHGRALLALPDHVSMVSTAQQILTRQLTVRDVERLAQQGRSQQPKARGQRREAGSPEIRQITDRLRRHLQTDVEIIADDKARGELRIRFYSADDLERLLGLIAGKEEDNRSIGGE